jgi:phosphopantetheine--protein transferase-like protein
MVGSISHSGACCAAVAARRDAFAGLGLDVERAAPLSEAVAARVCTPRERERLSELAPRPDADWARIVFSAKESVYKCWYPLARARLRFHDVEVVLDPGAGEFRAALVGGSLPAAAGARRFAGRFAVADGWIGAGVHLPA